MSKYKSKMPPLYSIEQRELEKAIYEKDNKKALDIIKKIEKMPKTKIADNGAIIAHIEDIIKEDLSYQTGSLLNATKRILQVQIILDDIFNKANEISNKQQRINYLIDERYTYRENVFDTKRENDTFKDEYNEYIADKVQKEIIKLYGTDTPINKAIDINKTLIWNDDYNKNILGTIFALLHDIEALKGQKSTSINILNNFINGLSKSSLQDNIYTKTQDNGSAKYDKELYNILKKAISKKVKQ